MGAACQPPAKSKIYSENMSEKITGKFINPSKLETEGSKSFCKLLMIGDFDKDSRVLNGEKRKYTSKLQELDLIKTENGYEIEFKEAYKVETGLGYKGRGAEFSAIKLFDDKLYIFCDKTGIIFTTDHTKVMHARSIICFEDGRPYKIEWATKKGNTLIMGSHGRKKYNSSCHVAKLDLGTFEYVWEDWGENYNKMQRALNVPEEGYVVHEAISWSDIHQRYFAIPRKINDDPTIQSSQDLNKCGDRMIICDENFNNIEVIQVQCATENMYGYNSFEFLPGTNGQIIIACKSMEDQDGKCDSKFDMFDVKGNTILKNVDVPGEYKYEGIEFIPANFMKPKD